MERKDVYIIHSAFFYYGFNHLLVYLSNYIKNAVDNNEVVYVSMDPDIYQKLIHNLEKRGFDLKNIFFHSVESLIYTYKSEGKYGLQNIISQEIKRGYKGICWIGQPGFAVQKTSKEDFLNWETVLSEILKKLQASLLCVYDIYDNIHDSKIIDDEIVKESLKTHLSILNE